MFEVEGLYNIFNENKGVDQLCGYHAFALSLYLKEDFFMTRLNYT